MTAAYMNSHYICLSQPITLFKDAQLKTWLPNSLFSLLPCSQNKNMLQPPTNDDDDRPKPRT